MTTPAAYLAAADQYQAVIDDMLNDHVAALRKDLDAGIDRADALMQVTTLFRKPGREYGNSMLLAAALVRLAEGAQP